jgi:hypothetical protein
MSLHHSLSLPFFTHLLLRSVSLHTHSLSHTHTQRERERERERERVVRKEERKTKKTFEQRKEDRMVTGHGVDQRKEKHWLLLKCHHFDAFV